MRNFNVLLLATALCFSVLCFSAGSCAPASLPDGAEGLEEPEGPSGPENPGLVEDEPVDGGDDGSSNTQPEDNNMTINITIGDKVFRADIETSETGKAFLARLPLTLDMSELNGNEKYCYGVSLPRADKYFDTLAAGDLMLYSGNCVVLFYGTAGGYSYTRIGRLQTVDGLADALGDGSVTVTFGNE